MGQLFWVSKEDKERIPEIDILLDDQEIWKQENFEAKIIHIPGHTLGHICFYFYKDKLSIHRRYSFFIRMWKNI